jgi:ERCC4-related helicase
VLLRINYDDAAKHNAVTPIKVLMVNVPPEEGVSYPFRSPVAWARHVYWRNDHRNGIIAKAVAKIPQWLGQTDPQILVMVDKLDHAYELRKKLPDYDIVYASKSDEFHNQLVNRKLAKDDEIGMDAKLRTQKRKDFEAGTLKKVIATHVWKQGVDFVNLQVFFRADGGMSEVNNIQLPGRLSRRKDGKEFGLLIDLYDRHDPKAYRRALERKRAYGDMGWDIQMIYDLDSPVDLTGTGSSSAKGRTRLKKSISKLDSTSTPTTDSQPPNNGPASG